jgi:hypothetical protein
MSNIASVKNNLKKASAEALKPTGRRSWNGRYSAHGIALNLGSSGTIALQLILERNNRRCISSLVNFSRCAGPGTSVVGFIMPLSISLASFNRF